MSLTGGRRPGTATVADEPQRLAVALARVLRRAGVPVPASAALTYAEALSAVGLSQRGPVYWAGRATLVRRPEDVAAYDRAFDALFLGQLARTALVQVGVEPLLVLVDSEDDAGEAPPPGDGEDAEDTEQAPALQVRYSAVETLRHKDFAACSPAELAEAERLMDTIRLGGSLRPTRRRRATRQRRGRPDLRRTVRHALRSGGEPIRREWSAPITRQRRVILLCDVSGSMETYARALLRLLHVAVTGRRHVEAFTIGTRLTRLTRELSLHDADLALARAADAVADWSGGTRLGAALAEFNDRWGMRGMARGAVVVILSDGWDRGDTATLTREMERLTRVAHKIVWVNPLKASPGYQPLARGMAAALPYVDEFVEGHSVASLEALAEVVSR